MAYPAAVTNEVDPVSRIEGHLGVAVNVTGGVIDNAFAHGNLWRGFENFLLGRDANDAITFVQRICGVCPVPHGMTSTHAVDSALGYSAGHITFAYSSSDGYGVPNKAVSIRNLVCACDSIMSSITHFYHLAAPSYIQGPNMAPWTPYFADSYYTELTPAAPYQISMRSHGKLVPASNATDGFSDSLWSTVIRSYVVAIRMRRLVFEAGALFAGRMPMTSTFVAGGVTFDGTENLTDRANKFEAIMKEVALFVIQEYVPIALALGLLYSAYDNTNNTALVATASTLIGVSLPAPQGYGSGLGRYLAWGAYPQPDGTGAASDSLASFGGFLDLNGVMPGFQVTNKGDVAARFLDGGVNSVKANLTEDIANSRYEVAAPIDTAAYNGTTAAYPGDVARTKPKRANGYTYMKAPRWSGASCEVGPLARMFVHGLFVNNAALASGALAPYYTAYVKGTGLNPAMVAADIAVVLFRAGLATLQNATVAGALSLPLTHDFTYAEVVANLAALQTLLGTTGAHATIAAAYGHADTFITGPIAAWVINLKAGRSTMDRLRARAIETLYLVQKVVGVYTPSLTGLSGTFSATNWVSILRSQTGTTALDNSTSTWKYADHAPVTHGWGAHEAARGALMHHISQANGKITKYQCIVPTTWNGSPAVGATPAGTTQAAKDPHGAIEAACMGAPFAGTVGPLSSVGGVEVLRIAQSFDPCIACAIH